jgi:urease accessory protein
VRAAATLDVGAGDLRWQDAPPVVLRPTGGASRAVSVHVVQAAGGPLGGDDLALTVRLAEHSELRLSSAGASVIQPGGTDHSGQPARWRVELAAAAGAVLRWMPEPTVVCAGASYHGSLHADLHPDATMIFRELVVLGRSGEIGGRCRTELAVNVGGRPLVRHESLIDGADAELSGPAGTGGHRVLGTVLVAGRNVPPAAECAEISAELSWATLPLDGPGCLVLALGSSVTTVAAALDQHLLLNYGDR